MRGFNVLVLDKNYQIVSLICHTNLQWNRKYHESGTFSIQIPYEQYRQDMRYVYTKDRPELGKITQVNYRVQNNYSNVQLSGYFLEKEPDRHVVFPNGTSNINNAPEWSYQDGTAEDVAYAYFNGFSKVMVGNEISDLEISVGKSKSRGKRSVHYRNGEYLGWKIYDILKPSGMSYRVNYDFVENRKFFEVWEGYDRTSENTDGNNPIVFSTRYGNIKNPNILISDTEYKNACIVINEQTDEDITSYITRAVLNKASGDEEYHFLKQQSLLNRKDYSAGDLDTAMSNEGLNALADYPVTLNVDFDAVEGSYVYRKDFDLGDKCTIVINELNMTMDARLIGCYEVIKSGKWTMTMEFGTPIIKR